MTMSVEELVDNPEEENRRLYYIEDRRMSDIRLIGALFLASFPELPEPSAQGQ
jgi:hypothetical protein